MTHITKAIIVQAFTSLVLTLASSTLMSFTVQAEASYHIERTSSDEGLMLFWAVVTDDDGSIVRYPCERNTPALSYISIPLRCLDTEGNSISFESPSPSGSSNNNVVGSIVDGNEMSTSSPAAPHSGSSSDTPVLFAQHQQEDVVTDTKGLTPKCIVIAVFGWLFALMCIFYFLRRCGRDRRPKTENACVGDTKSDTTTCTQHENDNDSV